MAVRKVREEFGLKNLNVMIPFCRNVEECEKVTKIMADCGLSRGKDFKVWLMAEIPSNIILADQFNKFVDGYSIGSNDLTMLVLAATVITILFPISMTNVTCCTPCNSSPD